MDSILQSVYFTDQIVNQDLHYHDYNQILYIAEGVVELIVEDKSYLLNTGDMAFVSRYERHAVRIRSQTCRRFVLKFSAQIRTSDLALLINRPAGFQHVVHLLQYQLDVKYILRTLMAEQSRKLPHSEKMQEYLLGILRVMILRCLEDIPCRKAEVDLVFQIQQLFEANCCREYSLEELADQFNVSMSTLSHQFKKVTGYSVFEYLTDRRLAAARSRLVNTRDPISRIAIDCGFGFSSNFSKVFRSRSGMTPTQYRKTAGQSDG